MVARSVEEKDDKIAEKKYPTVSIVDHKDLFEEYSEYLPTFNSLSIETMLYRIPGLAEQFIYFNDDFFLANNTKLEDFFILAIKSIGITSLVSKCLANK